MNGAVSVSVEKDFWNGNLCGMPRSRESEPGQGILCAGGVRAARQKPGKGHQEGRVLGYESREFLETRFQTTAGIPWYFPEYPAVEQGDEDEGFRWFSYEGGIF